MLKPSLIEAPRSDEHRARRRTVLDAVRTLLAAGEDDAVLELVTKLVAHNEELVRRLPERLVRGARDREHPDRRIVNT